MLSHSPQLHTYAVSIINDARRDLEYNISAANENCSVPSTVTATTNHVRAFKRQRPIIIAVLLSRTQQPTNRMKAFDAKQPITTVVGVDNKHLISGLNVTYTPQLHNNPWLMVTN